MNPLDELLALTNDLRAVLEEERLRGATSERVDAALPAAIPPEPVAAAPAIVAAPSASPWAAIAQASRRAVDEGGERGEAGLKAIRDDLGDCRRCQLCLQRKTIVFGVGDPDADLVVVGEGPGHEEDLSGEPFVGPAGQMLDKMLSGVLGLTRPQVYICNIVKCRPPGNRNPQPEEIDACRPFLQRQIRAVRPKVVLVLGNVAMKALLGTEQGITRSRGAWAEWEGIPVLPTFHPAYLLRNPDEKRKTFDDLKTLRGKYDELGGRR